MALKAELLRASLELVLEHEDLVTLRFYAILFKRYPQVQRLFGRRSQREQAAMLQEAIIAVVDHAEDPSWLGETLDTMGRTHVDYEVTEEMYPWVGECLLAALAEAAGPAWSSELEAAWSEAYAAISSAMIEGARARLAAEAS